MIPMQQQTQECHVTKTGCAGFCHVTSQILIHITQKQTEKLPMQEQTQQCTTLQISIKTNE